MAWKALLALTVLLASGLAGCIGDDAATDDELDAAAADGTTDPAPAALPALQAIPIEWDGAVGAYVYACPMVTCVGQGLPMDWDNFLELGTDPWPTAIELTMTWDHAVPTLDDLAIGVSRDDCAEGPCDIIEYAAGASPLTLNVADLDLDAADSLNLVVWRPYHAVGPVGGGGGLPAAFHVTGNLTAMA